jgi:DNA-binding NarL/FixJ family response regulator
MNKIILADPQEIYRIGISKALTSVDNFRIASQCADMERLLLAVEAYRPSIVVFSSTLTRDYASLMARIKAAKSRAVVIAEAGESPQQFIAHDVWGVIYRDASSEAFVDCIQTVTRGYSSIQLPPERTTSKSNGRMPHLTPRESEIVALLVQGCRNKEIAWRLGTTEQVVKNHLIKVYQKAGVSDRVDLALLATGNKSGSVEAQARTSAAKGR